MPNNDEPDIIFLDTYGIPFSLNEVKEAMDAMTHVGPLQRGPESTAAEIARRIEATEEAITRAAMPVGQYVEDTPEMYAARMTRRRGNLR